MFTCIAVDCQPGQVAACRDDVAVACNETGDFYDERQCEVGCVKDNGGCVECLDTAGCANPRPICDVATNSCVTCSIDDDCPSLACEPETGACLDAGKVLYASTTGVTNDTCGRDFPCSLESAIYAADGDRKTIRLLDGTYTGAYVVAGKSISLIGNERTIIGMGAQEALRLKGGANVYVRGVRFDRDGILEIISCCTEPRSVVALDQIKSRNLNVHINDGDVSVVDSFFDMDSHGGLRADNVSAKRSYFGVADPAKGAVAGPSKNSTFHVSNSVLNNVTFTAGGTSNDGGVYRLELSFNTVVVSMSPNLPSVIYCSQYGVVGYIDNNIIFGDQDGIQGANCAALAQHNVVFPQVLTLPATNIIASPELVSVPTDLRPKPDSPAVDAAMPVAGRMPMTDFLGTPRPQGPRYDIGAYELLK